MEAKTIKECQKIVKEFADRNSWKDFPNIDKIDHLHEELVEISQHIRYKKNHWFFLSTSPLNLGHA